MVRLANTHGKQNETVVVSVCAPPGHIRCRPSASASPCLRHRLVQDAVLSFRPSWLGALCLWPLMLTLRQEPSCTAWLPHKDPVLVPVFASRSTALHSSSGGYSVFISCSAPGLPHPGCIFYSLAIPWPTSLEGCCFLPTTGSQKGVVLQDK